MTEHDDKPIGRVLSRREVLALLGSAGVALLGSAFAFGNRDLVGAMQATPTAQPSATPDSTPTCIARPQLTEGPYFVENMPERYDIRADSRTGALSEGTPLFLRFVVATVSAAACLPLAGARVDVWHCDARGVYSGVRDARFDTRGQDFLRGYQLTDRYGIADFLTVYPGWYSGRAVHIHFKIRTQPQAARGHEFTSQLFFDEAVNAAVYQNKPYAARGLANVPNAHDGIYRNGGAQLTLKPSLQADGSYVAVFNIGLDIR
ncbi:MAG: twin-arginine translocation pathway signal protein [Candidatus Thermofonsia Clade 1 bacterium]|jgi:protocatechuate 3,4-dioxygenase beta subunit|uniref:Twin-arginine translocation pathway signal protein n=1 Tax=Candidatus Thermofonsia Clade 1 bacterium TaxID=2364210 RepID=A0A2M8PFR3_9CHLR|nr:MAG: twin-arginine translocation pathway signal protein [Candidatus Thermofonsia Clade 1 bacterium]PJF43089.1 MAG: twin-arginine translocation pathway signal protein [Candidatus Thermofonsia Clade 1 bacterium]RMF51748.1 MAG: twin-arginine translocation pathway signal protein [Chloroflexota bacterium]